MNKEELLKLYLEKLYLYASSKLAEKEISVLEALKESLLHIEGEMTGY